MIQLSELQRQYEVSADMLDSHACLMVDHSCCLLKVPVGSPRISASLGILAGILEMVARRAVRNTNSAVSLLLDTILHLISRTALLGYATQLAFERCWADTSVVRRNLERRAARRSSI